MLVFHGNQAWNSRTDPRKIATSLRIAMHDLKLDALYVMHPGAHRFSLADGVEPRITSDIVVSVFSLPESHHLRATDTLHVACALAVEPQWCPY